MEAFGASRRRIADIADRWRAEIGPERYAVFEEALRELTRRDRG